MPRGQLENRLQHRLVLDVAGVTHRGAQGGAIDLAHEPRNQRQRLELGGKHEAALTDVVEQRLDAGAVARQQQLLAAAVPEGEGEHALQPLQAVQSILLIGVENGFGVGRGAEAVAFAAQLATQLAVVVDFAIEGDDELAVFAFHRLVAGRRRIEDAQAAMSEADFAVRIDPAVIGPAIGHDRAHLLHQGAAANPYRARNTTHGSRSLGSFPVQSPSREVSRSIPRRTRRCAVRPLERTFPSVVDGNRSR